MVGDCGQDYSEEKKRESRESTLEKCSKSCGNFVVRLLSYLPLAEPNMKIKIISDIWLTSLILYRMFITTIKISFFAHNIRESVNLTPDWMLSLILISFIYDMCL